VTNGAARDLSAEAIDAAIALDSAGLAVYAQQGEIITDDNQLLSYSWNWLWHPKLDDFTDLSAQNHREVESAARYNRQ
jgi:hypothetical protein